MNKKKLIKAYISAFITLIFVQEIHSMSKIREVASNISSTIKDMRESSRGAQEKSSRPVEISGPTNVVRKSQEETLNEMKAEATKKNDSEAIKQIDKMLEENAKKKANEPPTTQLPTQPRQDKDEVEIEIGGSSDKKPRNTQTAMPYRDNKTETTSVLPSNRASLPKKSPTQDSEQFGAMRNQKTEQAKLPSEQTEKPSSQPRKEKNEVEVELESQTAKSSASSQTVKEPASQKQVPPSVSPSNRENISKKPIQQKTEQFGAMRNKKTEPLKQPSYENETKDERRTRIINESGGISSKDLEAKMWEEHQKLPLEKQTNEIKTALSLDPNKKLDLFDHPLLKNENPSIKNKVTDALSDQRLQQNAELVEIASAKMKTASEQIATQKTALEEINKKISANPNSKELIKAKNEAEQAIASSEKERDELSTIMKAAYDKGDAIDAQLRRTDPNSQSYGRPMGEAQQKMFAADEVLNAAYAKYKPGT
jgi:hypothetical protein